MSPFLPIFLSGKTLPLFTRGDIDIADLNNGNQQDLPFDKRVFFVPDANLFILLPNTNDRLVLHRMNVEEALEKSGLDYLFVTSQPPLIAMKGTTLSYQIIVKSKKGGVRYKLESGSQGMEIDAAGKLTWPVPLGFAEPEASAIVAITDAAGQQRYHTFALSVRD